MEQLGIGLEVIIVLATAIAGGILARLLKLPVLLGYLFGGIAVGPNGFGLISNTDSIISVATIGVVLLLFTLGLEFSLREIIKLGKVVVVGGICQMLLTTLAVFGVSYLLGFSSLEALFFGVLIAESSTAVILRLCMERGELDTRHGRITVSMSLVQDLSVVPVIVVMPALGGGNLGMETLAAAAVALLKSGVFLAVMLALGLWVIPWVLGKIAGQRSRELFLLTIIALAIGAALGAYNFGLSAAFGAFVAGLLISQSAFARQALADILPLRDVSSAVFFISLGMLFSLRFVAANWVDILSLVPIVLALKAVIAGLIIWLLGSSFRTSLLSGLGLIPVGEFSFILAAVGLEVGIFSDFIYSLIIAVALITMMISPFTLNLGNLFYRWLSQRRRLTGVLNASREPYFPAEEIELSRHAVICGYGRVGKRVAAILERQGFPYLVIDLSPQVISELRGRGIPCIYGDAANPTILEHAHLDKARVLICTFPDLVSEELIVRNALRINPKLDIVAVVARDEDAETFRRLGLPEVVRPHLEVSLEVIRHTLHRFGLSGTEIQYILTGMREGTLE